MKKAVLLAAIITCAGQLKAQNLNKTPKNNNAADKLFNLKPLKADTNLPKLIPTLPPNVFFYHNNTLLNTHELIADEPVYSRMPVVKTYPNDNMPIVKTDEPGVKYHMLIKKIGVVNPDSVGVKKEKVTP